MKLKTRRLMRKIAFKHEYKDLIGRQGVARFCRNYLYKAVANINQTLKEEGSSNRIVFSSTKSSIYNKL